MVDEVPPLPAAPFVWRILGEPILLFVDEIPLPGAVLFRQPFPGFIPHLMGAHVRNGVAPVRGSLADVIVLIIFRQAAPARAWIRQTDFNPVPLKVDAEGR